MSGRNRGLWIDSTPARWTGASPLPHVRQAGFGAFWAIGGGVAAVMLLLALAR
jgi:hypothetical protein